MPAHIYALRSSPEFAADADIVPAVRLFGILCELTALHSHSHSGRDMDGGGGGGVVVQMTAKVAMAMRLEDALVAWAAALPDLWKYTTTRDDDAPDEVYGDARHEYACAWQAYVWNHWRICRILVHTILLRCLDALALPVTNAHAALVEAYTAQQTMSRAIVSAMLADVRASVRYLLGLYDVARGCASLSPEQSGVFGLLGSIQALMGVVDVRGEDAGWMGSMLEVMGERLGMGQACVLGRHLRATRGLCWDP